MTVLDDFFETFVPFVMGHLSSDIVEERLGPSPSGHQRLEVYAGVVPANLMLALADTYSLVKGAVDELDAELWSRLATDFVASHPPRHHDPNVCGRTFAAFVAERRVLDDSVPSFIEELADYEWIRVRASIAIETGFERSIFVRRYNHAISAFVDSREYPHSERIVTPEARPETIVVFRSKKTGRVRTLLPAAAELIALALEGSEIGESEAQQLASRASLSLDDLGRASRHLEEIGVIGLGAT